MKIPAHVLQTFEKYPHWLPLHPIGSWEPRPDDGGHTHCSCCGHTLYPGHRCVGRYFEYTCVVFCLTCVADNPQVMRRWMEAAPR